MVALRRIASPESDTAGCICAAPLEGGARAAGSVFISTGKYGRARVRRAAARSGRVVALSRDAVMASPPCGGEVVVCVTVAGPRSLLAACTALCCALLHRNAHTQRNVLRKRMNA